MALSSLSADSVFLGYVFLFAVAAVGCFASLTRIDAVDDTDTRWGLYTLLLTSGTWATTHVGYLLAPSPSLQYGFYVAGLIVGLAAVGPWLYFCSAYTGRSLHRDATIRRIALGVYLAVVGVKLTNPWHGLYFTTEVTTVPFAHLAVFHRPIHWLVMGLAYSLAIVGFFMLYELFFQVGGDTKPLAVLVALTGLPVVLDVLGAVSPVVIQFTYSPIGVAAFAIGVLFFFLDRFQRVQLAGARDDPVVVLDDDGEIWDYNRAALQLFPALEGRIGEPLEAVVPHFADHVAEEEELIEIDRENEVRYYQLSTNPFTTGHTRLGRAITLTDVTHRERYRQELERQNERLDEFAGMISHDLRNPLNVATGRIELARQDRDSEHLEAARDALERMEAMIEDVLALARQGQPIDDPEPVELSRIARNSWEMVESRDGDVRIESDSRIRADPDRLQQLLENLFRNAVDHVGTDVTVTVGDLSDGFYVEDDGPGIPEDQRGRVFESGVTTETDGTGFGLAIVNGIAEAHGWTVTIADGDSGGARFEFRNVTLLDD